MQGNSFEGYVPACKYHKLPYLPCPTCDYIGHPRHPYLQVCTIFSSTWLWFKEPYWDCHYCDWSYFQPLWCDAGELLWRTCASMQMSQAFQCHYEPSKTVEGKDWAEQVTKANYLLVGRNWEIRVLSEDWCRLTCTDHTSVSTLQLVQFSLHQSLVLSIGLK